MSTILLWGLGGAIGLAIMLSLPLVKHIAKPFMDEIVKLFALLFAHAGSYVVWMFKGIFSAHITLVLHLLRSKKYFDPTDGLDEE